MKTSSNFPFLLTLLLAALASTGESLPANAGPRSASATSSGACEEFPEFRISNETCDPVQFCRTKVRQSSTFNSAIKKCVLALGTPCRNQTHGSGHGLHDAARLVTCPPNSFCNADNVCQCEEVFIPDAGGQNCVRGIQFDAICDLDNDREPLACAADEGFACRNGKCVCELDRFYNADTDSCVKIRCEERGDSEVFFDAQTDQCMMEVGKERGYYWLRYLRDNLIACPQNAHLEEGYSETRVGPALAVCVCDKGFHQRTDRRACLKNGVNGEPCDLQHGDSCDSFAGLSCQRGVCDCQYAVWSMKDSLCYSRQDCRNRDINSYFEAGDLACYKEIGKACDPYVGTKCPKNSFCREPAAAGDAPDQENHHQQQQHSCTCDDHFVPARWGRGCRRQKQYGENCGIYAKGEGVGNPCAPESKLTCLEGVGLAGLPKCGCGPNQVWNGKDRICNLKEGQPCSSSANVTAAGSGADFQCTRNSKCETKVVGGNEGGVCHCDLGFVTNRKHECVAVNMEPTYTKCELTSDCS